MTRWSPVDEIFVNDRHASPLTDHLDARSIGSCASIRNYCSYVIVYWNGSWRDVGRCCMQTHGIERMSWMFYIWLGADLKRVSRVWGFNASIMSCASYNDMEKHWVDLGCGRRIWRIICLYNDILTGYPDWLMAKYIFMIDNIYSVSFFFYYKLYTLC